MRRWEVDRRAGHPCFISIQAKLTHLETQGQSLKRIDSE
jgi:hypothetical protein